MAREQILPSLLFALTPTLSHRARETLLSPLFTILYRDNKRHELPRPVGEGWGEGKHRAREMLLSPLFTILYRDNKRHELPRPVGEGWGEGKQVADCQYKGVAIHFPNLNAAFRTRKRHL